MQLHETLVLAAADLANQGAVGPLPAWYNTVLSIALAVLVVMLIGIVVYTRFGGGSWIREFWHRDSDDELIPANRNRHAMEYTEEDFPCPPAMPGKHSSIGSYFCDFDSKPGEVAFAVVCPGREANSLELKAIGERIQAWKVGNDQVRRILGLEQLLEGMSPTVYAGMFSLNYVEDHIHVGLIYVTSQADNEATGENLIQAMQGLPVEVCSPGYFSMLRS